MEHGKIKVEISETYPGSSHYNLTVFLPGYGANHKGFKLVDIGSVEREGYKEILDDMDLTFRPEYAKAIKTSLEKA